MDYKELSANLLKKEQHDDAGTEFLRGIWDETGKNAYNGVSQILNSIPTVKIELLAGPTAQDKKSLAHSAGALVGNIAEFTLLTKCAAPLSAKIAGRFGYAADSSVAQGLQLGLAGSFQAGLLRPSEGKNLLVERSRNAAIDFLTFASMGAVSHELGKSVELSGNSFKSLVFRNGIAGGASGFVHAEASSMLSNNTFASADNVAMDVGSNALFGAGFGAAQFGLNRLGQFVREQKASSDKTPALETRDALAETPDLMHDGQIRFDRAVLESQINKRVATQVNETAPHVEIQVQEFKSIFAESLKSNHSVEESLRLNKEAAEKATKFLDEHLGLQFEDAVKDWASKSGNKALNDFMASALNPSKVFNRRADLLVKTSFAELYATDAEYSTQLRTEILHSRANLAERASSHEITWQQYDQTMDNVLRLAEHGLDPRLQTPELSSYGRLLRRAAMQVVMQSGNPLSIVQYTHPTCSLASLEVDMYTRSPELASAAVSEVMLTGKFKSNSGKSISIDPGSLVAEFGSGSLGHHKYRSYASQVFQTLAANLHWQNQVVSPAGKSVPLGSLRYELHADPNKIGNVAKGYVVDYSGESPVKTEEGGYLVNELVTVGKEFFGERTVPRVMPRNLSTFDEFQAFLAANRKFESFPILASIDANHIEGINSPDRAGHMITLLAPGEFNAGTRKNPIQKVAIHNTWNKECLPQFLTTRQFWVLTQDFKAVPEKIPFH